MGGSSAGQLEKPLDQAVRSVWVVTMGESGGILGGGGLGGVDVVGGDADVDAADVDNVDFVDELTLSLGGMDSECTSRVEWWRKNVVATMIALFLGGNNFMVGAKWFSLQLACCVFHVLRRT